VSVAWFAPQSGDRDLAQHPHRFELRGAPTDFVWPDVCPVCGAPARDRLEVQKVFIRRHRGRGAGTWYIVSSLTVPFCEKCVDRHHAETRPKSPVRLVLTYFQSFLIVPVVGAAYLAWVTLPTAAGTTADQPAGRWAWGLVAALVGLCVASLIAMGPATRRFRVPPQTSITRAFDYSDELGNMVEGRRRAYAIQDGGFAERFRSVNGELAWTREHERRGLWRVAVLIGVAIAGLMTWRLLAG
jgi:hypothetical protein